MTRLRWPLFVISALAAVWALAVMLTGGFVLCVGSMLVSSTRPRNPAVIAFAAGLAACALSKPGQWRVTRYFLRRAGAPLAHMLSLPHVRWWRWSALPILIAIVGLAIQVHQWVGGRPLWLDEEMVALNFRDRTLGELAAPLWLGQAAPLGWLAAERAALLVIGSGEHALRLMPAAFGMATLLTALWVGWRWMSPVGATVLVLLCSFGQWLTFFPLELKHYSADSFWGLLLPVLGVWAVEPVVTRRSTGRDVVFRTSVWWAAAAIGQWFANGAVLVTPACAMVLFAIVWRRGGWRAALGFSMVGLAWLAAFALNYELSLRFTSGSEYLRTTWSFAMPPQSAGLVNTLGWLAGRLEPLAVKPGGSSLWLMFWIAAVSGLLLSARSALGLVLSTVPLSLFAAAGLRLVPLYERFSLWCLPALYVGIALFADATVRFGRNADARGTRNGVLLACVAGVGAFVGLEVCYDVYARGRFDMGSARGWGTNRTLDDRTTVRWLMMQRRPGDVLVTTHLALPAVWWYGRIPISDPDRGSRLADGSQILEIQYVDPGPDCRRDTLREALRGQSRALVYFGFRIDDVPKGFDNLLLDTLSELGALVEDHRFAGVSRAAVVDLHVAPDGARTTLARPGPRAAGCLDVRAANRW